jgi:hypothetical protein
MIWHEAVAPNLYSLLATPLGHQLKVGGIVALVGERLLATVSTLGYVVRGDGAGLLSRI